MKRLFRLAEGYRGKMILSVTCAIISVAAGIVPYWFVSRFVATIAGYETRLQNIYLLAVAVAMFQIVKTLFFSLSTLLSHQAAYRILRNLRIRLANKLTRMPLGYVLERDSGVIKKVMENDVEELERFLAHNIPETISSAVVPVAVLAYLAFLDWRLALVMFLCIPAAALFYVLMMRGTKEKMRQYYTAVDKMNAVVVEYVNGMKEIKAFNQSEHSFSRFRDAINEYRRYVLQWFKASWPFMSAYYVIIQASIIFVLPAGLYFLMTDSIELPVLVLFLLISLGFAAPLIKLTEFADSITLVVNAEQNIHQMLNEQELTAAGSAQVFPHSNVAFEHVSFSYNGSKRVLNDISFSAEEGDSVAIIGESGGGKSTIAKLICRFWDVSQGQITVGGVDIRKILPEQLMEKISFVFQDTFLFNMSISDNIRIGRPDATDEEVMEAAKMAKCHEFIVQMERGYDTTAGDGGNRFSGGERQRICIARAILKNAPVLVLDEATASIDPDCEEQIQEAIGALARGKTLIVIAHRIRTIMGFKKILVLREGEILAQGTHEELLEASTDYRSMFQAYQYTENWVVGAEGGDVLC